MTAINFSANGTRWRALPITGERLETQQVPAITGPGVLFTSADGEMRFLALDAGAVPSSEMLQTKRVDELSALVQRAKPVSR